MRRAASTLITRAVAAGAAAPWAPTLRAASADVAGAASPPSGSPPPSPSSTPARHPQFTVVGRLTGRVQIERVPVFAVVELGGAQVKLSPDDVVYTDRLPGVTVQDVVRLDRVLAAGTRSVTKVGRPLVPGAAVTAAVEEVTLDAKVAHFHKRRRKASRRLTGHRQPVTALRVLSVEGVE